MCKSGRIPDEKRASQVDALLVNIGVVVAVERQTHLPPELSHEEALHARPADGRLRGHLLLDDLDGDVGSKLWSLDLERLAGLAVAVAAGRLTASLPSSLGALAHGC